MATTPTLIPQPHGGALNSGGTIGNKGGRPRNEALALMAEGVTKGSKLITKLLDEAEAKPETLTPDQIAKLTDLCAKYTIGEKKVVEIDADKFAQAAIPALRDTCEEHGVPFTAEFAATFGRLILERLKEIG